MGSAGVDFSAKLMCCENVLFTPGFSRVTFPNNASTRCTERHPILRKGGAVCAAKLQ